MQREVCKEVWVSLGFPGRSVIKNSPANAGDEGSMPGSGRCPGEGHGNPLQSAHLGNLLDRGAWRAAVHGVAKSREESDLTEQLNNIKTSCVSKLLRFFGLSSCGSQAFALSLLPHRVGSQAHTEPDLCRPSWLCDFRQNYSVCLSLSFHIETSWDS